jgi:hypothetical protein
MQNCWNKYGVFKFTVLQECEKKELLLREQLLIDTHFSDPKNANLAPTAGSNLGVVRSVETRKKISEAKQNISAETRANMSAAQKGKVASAETRAKMSSAHKLRKPISVETRAKMSAWQKGRTGYIHSAETRAKMSAVRKGIPKSAEHRANISAGNRRRFDKFRMEKLTIEETDYGKKCS